MPRGAWSTHQRMRLTPSVSHPQSWLACFYTLLGIMFVLLLLLTYIGKIARKGATVRPWRSHLAPALPVNDGSLGAQDEASVRSCPQLHDQARFAQHRRLSGPSKS